MARVAVGEITVSYTRMGDWERGRVPVVLVHGLAASSAFWMHAADVLSRSFPVLVFDLRGHGRTTISPTGYSPANLARDLLALLDVLSISEVNLAGHSFGGSVALHAALHCPAVVRKLILADARLRMFQPTLGPAASLKWEERREELAALGFSFEKSEQEWGLSMLTELARLELRPEGSAGVPQWIHEVFGLRQSKFSAARWIELMDGTSLPKDVSDESELTESALRELPMPLLGIYGENSPVALSGRSLKELVPTLDLRIAPDAGHFFPAVRPKEFVDPVLEFLETDYAALK